MADLFGCHEKSEIELNGARVLPDHLDRAAQEALVDEVRIVAASAPFRQYSTPGGRKLSVRMTAAGAVGWITDRTGYRYAEVQPSGAPWPAIPASLLTLWSDVAGHDTMPDSLLLNFYSEGARMGLHQDKDEADTRHPVVSISLGDPCLFRVGGPQRGDSTRSIWLRSGSVVVLAGTARLAYHGVDRIKFGESDLLSNGGRLNLTLRVATG